MGTVILEKNKEVREDNTLELIGHWFRQDDSIYLIKLNN
jgi:hypothetical protein